ncbi:hypothetical protein PVAP13_8NG136900 [Panicum virgatum]|uniref:Uncharacterized protein n=1 Tax=Panicum virgatum TaxID=38727 RepID=A0A8T0P8Q4_PANVG|nr:hypothetical protein PVAP13_8NG136900 [Panicum virgatum]
MLEIVSALPARGHHQSGYCNGRASRLHKQENVLKIIAKVFAQPMASRTAKTPSATTVMLHTSAAADIGRN